jgi:signal transduction histidine kinase
MQRIISTLKRRYRELLHRSFGLRGGEASLAATQRLGQQLAASGLSMVELALFHEGILSEHLLPIVNPSRRRTITHNAGVIFSGVVAAADIGNEEYSTAALHLPEVLSSLSRRSRELADSNASLIQEIEQRKAAEIALATSEAQCLEMLEESMRLQGQLRRLSRQLLAAQEEERCKISRELHDVIGQTLTGINLQLTTLKQEARLNTANLERRIARTQRLVNRSVAIVHRFARELRPAVLDDLGLRPALEAHLKTLTRRSSVSVALSICPEVDQLGPAFRTTLFRVAQEALTNLVRHARADKASLTITRTESGLRMVVEDDGKGFSVARAFTSKHNKRLGLLGMRERVEMIDGCFTIVSSPSKGTIITVDLPVAAARPSRATRRPARSKES